MSKDKNKVELYEHEIPFHVSKCLAKIHWSERFEKELHKYGLVIIKPEAIMMCKENVILKIIEESGFELVCLSKKKITVQQTTEMWKGGWENASIERIIINQKLFSMYNSIILILRSTILSESSACEILTDLKGSSYPEKRKHYQIRSRLHPLNYILNYIHTSDDIADFLREIGILFDWDELINIFVSMATGKKITFPTIVNKNKQDYNFSLQPWVNNIKYCMKKNNMNKDHEHYTQVALQHLESNPNYKISLDLLQILCQYNLLTWNFTTIVILSNHIKYNR